MGVAVFVVQFVDTDDILVILFDFSSYKVWQLAVAGVDDIGRADISSYIIVIPLVCSTEKIVNN